jgi:hypothetical protein
MIGRMEEMSQSESFSVCCISFQIAALCAFVESFKTRPCNGLNMTLLFLLLHLSQEPVVVVLVAVAEAEVLVVVEEEVEVVAMSEVVVEVVEGMMELAGVVEVVEVVGAVVDVVQAMLATEVVSMLEEVVVMAEVIMRIARLPTVRWLLVRDVASHIHTQEVVEISPSLVMLLFRLPGSPCSCLQFFWLIASALADMQLQKFLSIPSSVLIWRALRFAAAVKSAFCKWPFPTFASTCSTYVLSGLMHLKLEACATF